MNLKLLLNHYFGSDMPYNPILYVMVQIVDNKRCRVHPVYLQEVVRLDGIQEYHVLYFHIQILFQYQNKQSM